MQTSPNPNPQQEVDENGLTPEQAAAQRRLKSGFGAVMMKEVVRQMQMRTARQDPAFQISQVMGLIMGLRTHSTQCQQ